VGMIYTELYSTRAYPTQARKQHAAGQQKGLMSSLGGVEGLQGCTLAKITAKHLT